MGVEPIAVLDHKLAWDELLRFPKLLEAEWSLPESPLRSLRAPVEPSRFSWRWVLSQGFSSPAEELFDAKRVRFESPCGLSGTVFRNALELRPFATWWSFVRDLKERRAIVAATERIATLSGSTVIIHLPDNGYRCSEARSLLYDGRSVPELMAWLTSECGPPIEDPSDIYVETPEGWTGDGYVVRILGRAGERGDAADGRRSDSR